MKSIEFRIKFTLQWKKLYKKKKWEKINVPQVYSGVVLALYIRVYRCNSSNLQAHLDMNYVLEIDTLSFLQRLLGTSWWKKKKETEIFTVFYFFSLLVFLSLFLPLSLPLLCTKFARMRSDVWPQSVSNILWLENSVEATSNRVIQFREVDRVLRKWRNVKFVSLWFTRYRRRPLLRNAKMRARQWWSKW
jgi:hypothetical protein